MGAWSLRWGAPVLRIPRSRWGRILSIRKAVAEAGADLSTFSTVPWAAGVGAWLRAPRRLGSYDKSADKRIVGRTNLIILFFGIFGCVALSLMMSHVVGIKDKKDVHPAVFELEGLFGDDLKRRSQLSIEKQAEGEVAVLTIYPKEMGASARLARMIGRHLLRFRGADLKFDALEVVARDASEDAPLPDKSFPIKVPRGFGSLRNRMLPMRGAPNRPASPRGPAQQRPRSVGATPPKANDPAKPSGQATPARPGKAPRPRNP